MRNIHEDLQIIDQLDEGADWFDLVQSSSNSEIARRIKATPTYALKKIVAEDVNTIQRDFAKKEFAYRIANDNINEDGDPKFVGKLNGYDKLNLNIHEKLTSNSPVEDWISDFVSSDNPKFDGKSKKDRVRMALGAYYASKEKNESVSEKRAVKILELSTGDKHKEFLKFFYESDNTILQKSTLEINDLYESFMFNLVEAAITIGSAGKAKCVKQFGACVVGKTYTGIWKQAAFKHQLRLDLSDLPGATQHPSIFFDKNTKQILTPKQFEVL
jgi:hypothetical protein